MAVMSRQRAANQVLIPVQRDAAPIAPLLPIQRDRRSVSPVPAPRLTKLALAFAASLLLWLAVIAGVAALAHTL